VRRLAAGVFIAALLAALPGGGVPVRAGGAKLRIQGASRVFPAAWGLVAQGSGMLQILPEGKSAWQTVHAVKGDSLYRVAFDDGGRLMASWEKEPYFHLFVPKQNQHLTFAKPPAPSPEFKYGYNLADLHFSKDGTAAIVYMHGFLGGRRWSTVAYHRIRPVWTDDEERVAVVIQEHPRGRHLLRWRAGEPTAEFRPLLEGPDYDTMDMRLTRSGDVVESWLTAERGLEVRRHSLRSGEMKVRSLPPHPRRTPHDHPLFGVNASMERKNGDVVLFWGEYLIVLPLAGGPSRRLDLRAFSGSRSEFAGLALYLPAPEGFWVGRDVGRAFDFAYLPFADFEKRATALP
jgi:hypothetical protein